MHTVHIGPFAVGESDSSSENDESGQAPTLNASKCTGRG